jgi:hypothetical protein
LNRFSSVLRLISELSDPSIREKIWGILRSPNNLVLIKGFPFFVTEGQAVSLPLAKPSGLFALSSISNLAGDNNQSR